MSEEQASGDAVRWQRASAVAGAGALLLGIRAIAPDPAAERRALLLVALGLGYGHLLGALCFGRRRRRRPIDRWLLGTTLLAAGSAFAWALASPAGSALLVLLAVLAVWHILENDLALGRAARGATRLAPLRRALWPHVGALAGALALVIAAILVPRFAPWLVRDGAPLWLVRWNPEEVFAALLLYHTLVWLVRGLAAVRARRAAIVGVHALPLLVLCTAGAVGPTVLALALSPAVYLFLSAAHAFHTSFERGLERG